MDVNTCKNCIIYENCIFSNTGLSEDEFLNNALITFHYKKGQIIFQEGDKKSGIYFIRKGKIKCSKNARNGQEIILNFITSGDIMGHSLLVTDSQKFEYSALCMEDAELCYIPYALARKQLESNIHLIKAISKRYHNDLIHFLSVIVNINTKSVRERMATSIIDLHNKFGIDFTGNINITVTREEIANMSSTTTESAIRYISEFKTENLILLEHKKIKIIDLGKLQKIAGVVYDKNGNRL